jgi:hypothetical protein
MSGIFFPLRISPAVRSDASASPRKHLRRAVLACALTVILTAVLCPAQVITIDTSGKGPVVANAPVDRRFAQITPTSIPLPTAPLDAKTRLELIRVLQAEQGFAMRPFPRGRKGLTLVANGKLEPAGEAYLNMVTESGTSAKPGDRLVLTDVKIDHNKIVFQINGGPDPKHRFLRHIQIGMGDPNYTNPLAQDDGQQPTGARLTLAFKGSIPALTGAQVKALLAPLISFDVKTPVQAFTDTLPAKLKEAILSHQVMVGMSTDMVLFAKGRPRIKYHDMDGQMPIDEWIYGTPPEEVDFVRINGNRVIRVEVAKVGVPPVVFTKDEVSGMLLTDGTPVETAENHVHIIKEGDVHRDPDKEAPAAPPSLRNPGEKLPSDDSNANTSGGQKNVGVMRPVQAPVKRPEYQPGANPDSVPDQAPPAAQPASPTSASPAPAAASQGAPATASQPQPAAPASPPASANQHNQ